MIFWDWPTNQSILKAKGSGLVYTRCSRHLRQANSKQDLDIHKLKLIKPMCGSWSSDHGNVCLLPGKTKKKVI